MFGDSSEYGKVRTGGTQNCSKVSSSKLVLHGTGWAGAGLYSKIGVKILKIS